MEKTGKERFGQNGAETINIRQKSIDRMGKCLSKCKNRTLPLRNGQNHTSLSKIQQDSSSLDRIESYAFPRVRDYFQLI